MGIHPHIFLIQMWKRYFISSMFMYRGIVNELFIILGQSNYRTAMGGSREDDLDAAPVCSLLCLVFGMLKEILGEDKPSSKGFMVASGIMEVISSFVVKHTTNQHGLHTICNVLCAIALALSLVGAALDFILWLCIGSNRAEGPERLMLVGAIVSALLDLIKGVMHLFD